MRRRRAPSVWCVCLSSPRSAELVSANWAHATKKHRAVLLEKEPSQRIADWMSERRKREIPKKERQGRIQYAAPLWIGRYLPLHSIFNSPELVESLTRCPTKVRSQAIMVGRPREIGTDFYPPNSTVRKSYAVGGHRQSVYEVQGCSGVAGSCLGTRHAPTGAGVFGRRPGYHA